jgi:hypothetical protein
LPGPDRRGIIFPVGIVDAACRGEGGRLHRSIHFVIALLLCVPSVAYGWAEYRSDNFAIYTDLRPRAAESALKDLERFRIATLAVTGLPPRDENVRMQIVLFARSRDFNRFRPNRNVAAFYADTWAGPRMVIGAHRGVATTTAYLYHEYVHYLLREHSDVRYPMWYDEGFAEVLASAEVRRDGVRIGSMNEDQHHLSWLRAFGPLPVAELLSPRKLRRRDDLSQFYASAWLFTHYLQLGRHAN